jgi:uncharacterized protein
MRLNGARVLLTGASSGIGRALTIRLAAEGCELALAARRSKLLDALADEVESAGQRRPHVLSVDLSQVGAANLLAQQALSLFDGRVDALVNNAGASLIGSHERVSDSGSARAVYETNLWSPIALAAALLPVMRAAGSGMIVNVTSTTKAVPLALLGYYAGSKAALSVATQALRHELADSGIRVLEVVPGATDTALRDVDEMPWKNTPPRTLPPTTPQKVADAIARAMARGRSRLVYPRYALVPVEVPSAGRLVAAVGSARIAVE